MTRLAPIQPDISFWKIPALESSSYAAIPWEEHVEIWKNYNAYGYTQTAERIAERGGFGIKEAAKFYKMNPIVVWFSKGKGYPKCDEAWIKMKITFKEDRILFEDISD